MKREISLLQATSINMIDMVGIGPFVTMTIVMQTVGSSLFLWAWIFGAITALVDGMIWSELGAAYPLAGGSYNFLKEAYGPKYGPLMSFLFVWQTCLQAPLVIASAAIGFADYFGSLADFGYWGNLGVRAGVIILVVLLLFRNIREVGKISVLIWSGVVVTILWIIISGFTHQRVSYSFMPTGSQTMFSSAFGLLLGQASVKTVYCYLGYYNVCHLGGDIKDPGKNIPRSIFISIICISVLYLAMNLSIVRVIPWQQAMGSKTIVTDFMRVIYGSKMATAATILILWVAFGSLFAVLLGYSRIPYAAAVDGQFFPFFAWLHPRKGFPYVSLLFMGALGLVLSLTVPLKHAISAILAMRVLVQFIAQAAGVVLLRNRKGTADLPFKMWLYPLPVVLSIAIWLFIWYSTGLVALFGLALAAIGVVVFFLTRGRWKKVMIK